MYIFVGIGKLEICRVGQQAGNPGKSLYYSLESKSWEFSQNFYDKVWRQNSSFRELESLFLRPLTD